MSQYQTVVHLVAGGLGGTAGAIATCPLEVVKTRLQSSVANFSSVNINAAPPHPQSPVTTVSRLEIYPCTSYSPSHVERFSPSLTTEVSRQQHTIGIWRCLKHIVESEGARALFKGLGPNLVGVAPSRGPQFGSWR